LTTTFAQLNARLDLFMGDTEVYTDGELETPRSHTIPLRIASWNWAQDIFCAHTPRQRIVSPVTVDTGQRAIVVPSDLYRIEKLYDSEYEKWWAPVVYDAGDIRYESDELKRYWEFGGQVFLEAQVPYSSDRLSLYYWAYWPDVTYEVEDDDSITYRQGIVYTPKWAELALVHLVAANCMMPLEMEASDINEWRLKVEAGTPLDNPRAQSGLYHLQWYHELLERFPPSRGI